MGEAAALPPLSLARLLSRYIAVVAAAVAALLVLDAVPWLLTGAGRGVVTHRSVEAAEHALGATLLLPAFFPDSYRWPPAGILTARRPARAAALVLAPEGGEAGSLLFVQTLEGSVAVPEELLPKGKEIHRVDFDLDGTPARMTDVLLPPDGTFHDLSFVAKGRRVVFRFRGDPVVILKMAASLARRGGG
jgi:hypothetical protein